MKAAGELMWPSGVQIIARIHTTQVVVRRLIHNLLVKVGRQHPQSLMYPLLVACKSQSTLRQEAARRVVDAVRTHSPKLVEEAEMVRSLFPLPDMPAGSYREGHDRLLEDFL